MNGYRYDVFLSFKSDSVFNEWIDDHFLPIFSAYLTQDVRVACKRAYAGLFYSPRTLEAGDPWPQDLKLAILQSRVAIALCSPEYFYSKWCLSEFHSFWDRAKTTQRDLLVPVKIYDGEGFPTEVTGGLQFKDFGEFVIIGEAFKSTPKYVRFQEELKRFSVLVARRISQAPDYSAWPFVEKAPSPEPPVEQRTLEPPTGPDSSGPTSAE
jgi:hypothetical protein